MTIELKDELQFFPVIEEQALRYKGISRAPCTITEAACVRTLHPSNRDVSPMAGIALRVKDGAESGAHTVFIGAALANGNRTKWAMWCGDRYMDTTESLSLTESGRHKLIETATADYMHVHENAAVRYERSMALTHGLFYRDVPKRACNFIIDDFQCNHVATVAAAIMGTGKLPDGLTGGGVVPGGQAIRNWRDICEFCENTVRQTKIDMTMATVIPHNLTEPYLLYRSASASAASLSDSPPKAKPRSRTASGKDTSAGADAWIDHARAAEAEYTVKSPIHQHVIGASSVDALDHGVPTICGPGGWGKTHALMEIGADKRLYAQSFVVPIYAGTERRHLVGGVYPMDKAGAGESTFVNVNGAYAQAFLAARALEDAKKPGRVLLVSDEFLNLPPRELATLKNMVNPQHGAYELLLDRPVKDPLSGDMVLDRIQAPSNRLVFSFLGNMGDGADAALRDGALRSRLDFMLYGPSASVIKAAGSGDLKAQEHVRSCEKHLGDAIRPTLDTRGWSMQYDRHMALFAASLSMVKDGTLARASSPRFHLKAIRQARSPDDVKRQMTANLAHILSDADPETTEPDAEHVKMVASIVKSTFG